MAGVSDLPHPWNIVISSIGLIAGLALLAYLSRNTLRQIYYYIRQMQPWEAIAWLLNWIGCAGVVYGLWIYVVSIDKTNWPTGMAPLAFGIPILFGLGLMFGIGELIISRHPNKISRKKKEN